MTKMVPIAITILKCQDQYLFLKRRNPPYEGLWSLVGGKVSPGEHVQTAAIREVLEEAGSSHVHDYDYRGFVSERLVDTNRTLLAHFLIFVGYASIADFKSDHREGDLSLFTLEEINDVGTDFLPSDMEMFKRFREKRSGSQMHEAELLYDGTKYRLIYYRAAHDENRKH